MAIPKMAMGLSALMSLNVRRPLRPAGERPTICDKHDDDRGPGITEGAEKRTEVRRVD